MPRSSPRRSSAPAASQRSSSGAPAAAGAAAPAAADDAADDEAPPVERIVAAMVRGLASAFRGTEDPDEEFEELREFGEFERLGGVFMSMQEDESFMEHMTTGFRDAFEAYQEEHVGDDDDDSDADEEFPHIDYDGDLFLPSFEEEFLRRYYDQFPDARASRDAREARRAAAAPAAAAAAPAVAPAAAPIAVAAAPSQPETAVPDDTEPRAALALLLQYLRALPPLPATHSEAVRTPSLPTPAPLPAPSREHSAASPAPNSAQPSPPKVADGVATEALQAAIFSVVWKLGEDYLLKSGLIG